MGKKFDIESLKKDKEIFEVPEGYFDKLPSRIQARIKEEETTPQVVWVPRLAWAAPVLVIMLGFLYFYNATTSADSVDELLAQVSTDEMIAYLDLDEISEEELVVYFNDMENIDDLDFGTGEADLLDELGTDDLDHLIDTYDLNEEI